MKHIRSILLLICLPVITSASIVCPHDVTVTCDTDLDDLSKLGTATLFGDHVHHAAKYIDIDNTNQCSIGEVVRQWYVDLNYNGAIDNNEPVCQQTIVLEDIPSDLVFTVPDDITLSCKEDIPTSKVHVRGGPCDFIGHDYKDQEFGISPDACYKILRKFTLIDWCTYNPQDPNWNGEGLYEFTQRINVIDTKAPNFNSCEAQVYPLDEDCKARVVLTKSAEDIGDCASNQLYWEAEIDLWANGDIDYTYSYRFNGRFNIPLTKNNEEVSLELPEALESGNHKIKWKVRDACGNWKSCSTNFTTEDKKAPTPYCRLIVYAKLDGANGGTLEVPADVFDLGAIDNCSTQEKIDISFSNDPQDDTLIVDCVNQGFQFLRVFAHDKAGNHEYCEAFMLVLDNGGCFMRFDIDGQLHNIKGVPLKDVNVTAAVPSIGEHVIQQSKEDGVITFQQLPQYEDLSFSFEKQGLIYDEIDLVDYHLLVEYLLGRSDFNHPSVAIVADLDGNSKLTPNDLQLLKEYILRQRDEFKRKDWQFIADHLLSSVRLTSFSNVLPIQESLNELNVTGFMTGDISVANDTSLHNRSPRKVVARRWFDGQQYVYTLDESIQIKAIQLHAEGSDIESLQLLEADQEDITINEDKSTITAFSYLTNLKTLDEFIINAALVDNSEKIKVIDVNNEVIELEIISNEVSLKADVFPNPTDGVVSIVNRTAFTSIEVLNVRGETVASIHVNDQKYFSFNLKEYTSNSGIYFIQINSLRNPPLVKKVVLF